MTDSDANFFAAQHAVQEFRERWGAKISTIASRELPLTPKRGKKMVVYLLPDKKRYFVEIRACIEQLKKTHWRIAVV